MKNSLLQYTNEKEIPFLDLGTQENILEAGILPEFDFYDENHLNISGASKIANFISNEILDIIEIQDKRGINEYSSWEHDLKSLNHY